MAKGIPTLIKLKKREVDELRKELAGYERQKDTLIAILKELAEQVIEEAKLVAKQPEIAGYFGEYRKRIKKRQEDIGQEITRLDNKINTVRDQITDAFSEQKRYEIVAANAAQRALREQNRKQQIMLDELGGQQFRNVEENAN